MHKIYLVRHGKSAQGFHEVEDSDLSALGHSQASAFADEFAHKHDPMPIIASPMRRARQTADALAKRWSCRVGIEQLVGEVPVPATLSGPAIAQRRPWLTELLTAHYPHPDPAIEAWRAGIATFLNTQTQSLIVFTHYLTINAAVGLNTGNSAIDILAIDYCGVVTLEAGQK